MATRAKKPAPKRNMNGPSGRVEIRINGTVRFANFCYGILLEQDEDGEVTFLGSLQAPPAPPAAPAAPPQRWGEDIRDGEEIIQQVHSGRRT
jgi:hypothetical protein